VLRPGGRLLVAVPAADDLVELRTAVQGAEMRRDRLELLVAAHNDRFAVVDRATVREQLTLERAVLLKLLQATYRGERFSESPAVRTLDRLEVTLASDVVLFAPR
jgi:hypothetical protein